MQHVTGTSSRERTVGRMFAAMGSGFWMMSEQLSDS